MQIQVNAHSIEGREGLAAHVQSVVESALNRFRDQITRVEVHLSDQNGDKRGPGDKRCMIEARLKGRQPTAVTHDASSLDQAIDGAANRMHLAIEHALGRLRDQG